MDYSQPPEKIRSPAEVGSSALVIGLCGASNSGKTTLAQKLLDQYQYVTLIHQDDFYKEDDKIPEDKDGIKLWDVIEAIDAEKFVSAIQLASSQTVLVSSHSDDQQNSQSCCSSSGFHPHLVIVEGTMLLSIRELRPLLNVAYFLTLDYDTMKERRRKREYEGPHDPPGYFEDHVWPSYMRDMKVACGAHSDGSVRMLDGTKEIAENLNETEIRIDELICSHRR